MLSEERQVRNMKNKNDVQAMLKEAGILFAITLIAGLLLGFVYELTKAVSYTHLTLPTILLV